MPISSSPRGRHKSRSARRSGATPNAPALPTAAVELRSDIKPSGGSINETQQVLQSADDPFSSFMQNLPAASFIKDNRGNYLYTNKWFENVMRPSDKQDLRASDEALWPESAAVLRKQDKKVIESGRAIIFETSRRIGESQRYFQTFKFPITDRPKGPPLIGGIAIEVTDRMRAEEAWHEMTAKLAAAQEEERRRISREIHDELAQQLAGLAVQVGGLAVDPPRSVRELSRRMKALQQRVMESGEIARHIAYQLHPSELDDLGLVAALRSLCEDFGKRERMRIHFAARGSTAGLPMEIGSCVYKLAQASLRNVAQHAHTREASVAIERDHNRIRVTITDKGNGFKPSRAGSMIGLGIEGMRERVRLVHGTLAVLSKPGTGTKILAEVPLPEANE